MSLLDRYTSIIIADPALMDGQWHAGEETGSSAAFGWDSLSIPYRKLSATPLTPELARADFLSGTKLGTRNFWVQNIGMPVHRGGGLWEVTVNYKGLSHIVGVVTAPQRLIVTTNASGNEQSVSPAIINGISLDQVSIHQNSITATARYIVIAGDVGQSENVGTAQTPPNPPASPPSFWLSIADPVYHYPNGWVLMSSDVEPLPGTGVGIVTDNYQYIQEFTPG